MRATLLFAHPDDEVIFAGGLMLEHREIEWDWVCATYKSSDPRARKLRNSADAFRRRGAAINRVRHMGMEDDGGHVLSLELYRRWRDAAAREVQATDLVVTHGRMGEYGHAHHMGLHAIACELWPETSWFFLAPLITGVGAQERLPHVHEVPVAGTAGIAKRAVMQEAYRLEERGLRKHMPELMDAMLDVGPETFTSSVGWPS